MGAEIERKFVRNAKQRYERYLGEEVAHELRVRGFAVTADELETFYNGKDVAYGSSSDVIVIDCFVRDYISRNEPAKGT